MTTTTNKNFNNTIITKITGRQIGPFPVGKTAEFFKIDGRQIGRSANRSITEVSARNKSPGKVAKVTKSLDVNGLRLISILDDVPPRRLAPNFMDY